MNRVRFVFAVCILFVIRFDLKAQILHVTELATRDIEALNRDRTAVILPGGILEQHGPYLPSYTDGYVNAYIAQHLAEAVAGKPGWIALLFPQIPLGTGGANEIGGHYVYPGTYAIRSTTLRAVYMDLAMELGEQGFKWIFVVHGHGAPNHNNVLDEAGDFFNDTFGGQMIHLTGLILPPEEAEAPSPIDTLLASDGSPHAGVDETSMMLFLKPELVRAGVVSSQTVSAPDWETRRQTATSPQWPGYFGTPRNATAAQGAQRLRHLTESLVDMALQILDGLDASQLQRLGDLGTANPGNVPINEGALERESQVERMQQDWLRERTEQ